MLDVTIAALALCGTLATNTAAARDADLKVDSDVATAGYYQLRWFTDSSVELEEAQSEDFEDGRTLYSGSDKARIMSGKPDGTYYYRLRGADDGSLGNTVKVTVRHHSLQRALAFFGLGASVFFATLLLIVCGACRGNEASR